MAPEIVDKGGLSHISDLSAHGMEADVWSAGLTASEILAGGEWGVKVAWVEGTSNCLDEDLARRAKVGGKTRTGRPTHA